MEERQHLLDAVLHPLLGEHAVITLLRARILDCDESITELTPEQAAYIGVPKQGPYKPDTYRY